MFKPDLGYVLLFVNNPLQSSDFYSELLGLKPVERSGTFALFVLGNGVKLGLWSKHTAEPLVQVPAGSMEICFACDDVDATYQALCEKNLTIAQSPVDMDFGRTMVFLDLDGHRIRMYKMHPRQ